MLAEINLSLREAMRQLVRHLRNRLTPRADGTQKGFKASTVNNLLDFLGRFDAKNLGKDTELTDVVSQAKITFKRGQPQGTPNQSASCRNDSSRYERCRKAA